MGIFFLFLFVLMITLLPVVGAFLSISCKKKLFIILGYVLTAIIFGGLIKLLGGISDKAGIVLSFGFILLIFYGFYLKEKYKKFKYLGILLIVLSWIIGSFNIIGIVIFTPENPNILNLANKPTVGTIKVKNINPFFKSYPPEKRELLEKYLSRSKDWQLTRLGSMNPLGGALVALKRVSGNPMNLDVLDNFGYTFRTGLRDGEPFEEKTMVCFEPINFNDSWRKDGFVNNCYDSIFKINQYTGFKGEEYEYFILKFNNFSFEAFERGSGIGYIQSALDNFKEILEKVSKVSNINDKEIENSLISDESIKIFTSVRLTIFQKL